MIGKDAVMAAIADRLDIQQLVNRYAVHIDLQEVDFWVDLFEPDGILDESGVGMGVLVGHAAIRAYGRQLAADNLHAVHFMTNHVITDLSDVDATGTAFAFVEAMTRSSGHGRYYIMYRDRYRKSEGAWRFRERIISPLFPPMAVAAI
jgi:hypothetical protein